MRIIKTLLIGLVIAWGLLALAVRATTPFLGDMRNELASWTSERLGVPLSAGELKARWYGLRPLLELRDVTIGEAPHAIHARHIVLDLSATELLTGDWPDALRVTAEGLQIKVVREPGGQVHVVGLPRGSETQTGGAVFLPRHVRLLDTRIIWHDRAINQPPIPLDDVDVRIDRDGEQTHLRARLQAPGGSATLAARLNGQLADIDWSGDVYLQLDKLDVAELLGAYLPARYGIDNALLDMRIWSHWDNAAPIQAQGHVALHDARLRPAEGGELDLHRFGAELSLHRSGDSLRVGLDDIELITPRQHWPRSKLALAIEPSPDGVLHVDAAASHLRLDDIAEMLRVRPVSDELDNALATLQPRGEVKDLRIRIGIGDTVEWRAHASFHGVTTEPSAQIPGIDKLSGDIHSTTAHSVLTLDSHDTTLRFTDLFRNPLELKRLAGRIDLEHTDDGWRLRSDRLQADAPHLRTVSRMRLAKHDDRALFIDMQTDFRDGDATHASLYYPAGIMGAPLVRWLDRSIKTGHVISGTALLHGPLDDFAFEKTRSGSFQVIVDATDVAIDYRDGWPPLTQLGARVKFHGNQVEINADRGTIYASQIDHVSAHITSLEPISPIRIRGRLQGPLGDELRVLGEPALRDRFGTFASILRGVGDSVLDLDFSVPLGRYGDYALDGQLQFAGNRLTLPDWDFALDDIHGQLNFTLDGLHASGIRAKMLNTPVSVDVTPINGATRVRGRGRFSTTELARRFGALPPGTPSGAAEFTVDVDVPAPSRPGQSTRLAVRSDLAGIAIDLPEPIGKTRNSKAALRVDIPLGEHALSGKVSYKKQLTARFSGDGQRIGIHFGGDARLPQNGIRLDGKIDRLDAAAWQRALTSLGDGGGDAPLAIDLRVDVLDYDDIRLGQAHVAAQRDSTAWRGTLRADQMAGKFTVPNDLSRAPIDVTLDRAVLDMPETKDGPGPRPNPAGGPDPSTQAGLRLDIADLQIGEAKLGRLKLQTERTPEGLRFSEMTLSGGQLVVNADGAWTKSGGRFRTEINGKAQASDLGELLVGLGYSRQLVDADGNIGFNFAWPGNPLQWHRAVLSGSLDIAVGKGRLVELDPGVTRVVGLLNLNALTRRLRLDFSDFYKKGYSFDAISGRFAFANGSAQTDDLTMSGPTGRIEINGTTDLVGEQLAQNVTVTPSFDATLPIASTIAGGPVAGIAVLVAQKALSKQVDDINRFEYRVSGAWDDPEITALDTGGTLSKLLRPFQGDDSDRDTDETPAETTPPAPARDTPPAAQTDRAADVAVDTEAQDSPTLSETEEKEADAERGPLRGVIDFFKRGQPHVDGLPGD